MSLDFISNNSLSDLIKVTKGVNEAYEKTGAYDYTQSEGMDCLVAAILSWGRGAVQDLPRKRCNLVPSGQFDQAPSDFSISLSEHALRFKNHHFWLSDKDLTWHRPMQLYLRLSSGPKKRKTKESLRRQFERQGCIFREDWWESPRDHEVGSRQRPIDMLDIHKLDGENVDPYRSCTFYETPRPNVQYGGSCSSAGR